MQPQRRCWPVAVASAGVFPRTLRCFSRSLSHISCSQPFPMQHAVHPLSGLACGCSMPSPAPHSLLRPHQGLRRLQLCAIHSSPVC